MMVGQYGRLFSQQFYGSPFRFGYGNAANKGHGLLGASLRIADTPRERVSEKVVIPPKDEPGDTVALSSDEEKKSGAKILNEAAAGEAASPEDTPEEPENVEAAAAAKANAETKESGYTQFRMTAAEFGREPLAAFADFLRTEVGSEEAAKYIETLGDQDDVFGAVDQVRNMLVENTYVTEPSQEEIERFGAAFPQRAGEGVEQLKKVTLYLATNMVDSANAAIQGNSAVKARLKDATQYDARNESETYGLYSWPGGVSVGRLCDYNYGDAYRTWSFGEYGDTKGADRFLKPIEIEVDGKRTPVVYTPPSQTGDLLDTVA